MLAKRVTAKVRKLQKQILLFSFSKGSFKNYVYKRRGVGVPKRSTSKNVVLFQDFSPPNYEAPDAASRVMLLFLKFQFKP